MSTYIHKSHNVTVLMYHLVFPAKYRRAVFDEAVDKVLKDVCLEIEQRYEIKFLEVGTDKDHVHFLVQSVPLYSVKKIVQMLKSITAREVFGRCPEVKKKLWGGEFWTDGYIASTVGKHGDEAKIGKTPPALSFQETTSMKEILRKHIAGQREWTNDLTRMAKIYKNLDRLDLMLSYTWQADWRDRILGQLGTETIQKLPPQSSVKSSYRRPLHWPLKTAEKSPSNKRISRHHRPHNALTIMPQIRPSIRYFPALKKQKLKRERPFGHHIFCCRRRRDRLRALKKQMHSYIVKSKMGCLDYL